ncbi:putative CoA-binding protein [Bradyrhizobium sp. LM6.11]
MSNSKDAVRKVLDQVKADNRTNLTAPEGKLVCDAYGIPVPKEGVAKSAGEAGKMASSMGFPVVMKIVSPDILHKTEAGGVIVGLKTAEDAEKAYETILGNAKKYKSDAKIEGVQVQQMLAGGTEVIVGSITDASFGKLVAFGLGGVLVEVLKDITFRLAPATKQDALSMLDGIQAHEILKGVRGGEPVNRTALADIIVKVSQLVTDFPEMVELDLNPVFATAKDAIAADVRIVVDFAYVPKPKPRPTEEIVAAMSRIMQPKAVAVVGASAEDGKIGNSVMKNLINGGYKGDIYPIHPKAAEILGYKAYKSVKDVPGVIDTAVFAIPAKFVAAALTECGEKKIPGAVLIPSGFAEAGAPELQAEIVEVGKKYDIRLMGPNIYGFYYTPANLCATFCTAYDVKGHAALSCAVGWHRHGHHRFFALGKNGCVGHRRSRQQVRYRRGRSARLLRAGSEHQPDCAALRGSQGRPRLCRSRKTRLQEEACHRAQGWPHLRRCEGSLVAHRRARRQRQDLRGRPGAVRRDPRPLAAAAARVRARRAGAADAQGRERPDHHRCRRLGRAAVGLLRRQRPVADDRCRRISMRPSASSSRRSARPEILWTSPVASRRSPTSTRSSSA